MVLLLLLASSAASQSQWGDPTLNPLADGLRNYSDSLREQDRIEQAQRDRARLAEEQDNNLRDELSNYAYCYCSGWISNEKLTKYGYPATVFVHSNVAQINDRRSCCPDLTMSSCESHSAYMEECEQRLIDINPALYRLNEGNFRGYCSTQQNAKNQLRKHLAGLREEIKIIKMVEILPR